MLPEGWRNIEFGKLFDIKSGVGFKYSEYRDKGIPLIKIDNIGYGHIKWENKSYLPIEYANEYPDLLLNEGDILLALNRPITQNKLKIARVCKNDIPSMLYQRVGKIYGKSNLSFSDFFYYVFNELIFDFVKNKSIGSDQPFISTNELKTIKLPLPPLPEQKKIAAILSTWDRAIERTEKLLANSQQQKKALMQQLLTGKKRLPGFTGEWKNVLLKNIALIKKGQALSSKDLIHGDYPVIAGGKTSPYTHKHFTHENVITVSASGAYAGYVSFHSYKIWASDCSVITNRSGNNISFIYFWLSSLQNKIFSLQSGGAQPHIYPRDLELLHIHCPPLPEQKAIAAVLTTANEEITTLESDLSRLRQEKKALMQQLLTGKRRVRVD